MIISNLASRLLRPFANAGAKATIPLSQTDATRASYEQGFPALNMTPIAAGGVPPSGQDFNGVLYDLSNAALWQQAAGILPWDAGFAQSPVSGGYPKNALVIHNAMLYQSSVDNNTETPGAGTNWRGVGVSNASQPQHAVTLGQMHDAHTGYVKKTGDTMTGPLTIPNGTASGHAVNLGQFDKSLSANGYQKLPSGLIIQWVSIGVPDGANDGTYSATLPMTFPTAALSAAVSISGAATNRRANLDTFTNSTVSVRAINTGTAIGTTATAFVIGY